MRKLNRSSWRVLALVLLAAASLPAAAEQASARFTVSAFVPQRVSLQAIDQPALLAVSSEDITRGYKDLSARYEVRHNTAHGYLLSLSPRLGLASRVEVLGLDSPIELGNHSVEVYRNRPSGLERLVLTFRFVLEATARPGSYALPVHLSASPR
jgi:hypothetical protein